LYFGIAPLDIKTKSLQLSAISLKFITLKDLPVPPQQPFQALPAQP
jgi:hypothetical protein